MPEKLHRKLVKEAAKKGLKGERKNAYIYSVLNKVETGDYAKAAAPIKKQGK